jgi:trehalose 6-phosphate synthase
LRDREVIVVSNREPYIHNKSNDSTIKLQVPASGMVAALEPVMRACGGTWIAHGHSPAQCVSLGWPNAA